MKKLLCFGFLFLSGCAFDGYTDEKQLCESKPSWVEYAQCLNRIGMVYYGNDASEHTMIAYRNFLIEQVQTKKITPAQAEYMRQEKWEQVKQGIYSPPPRFVKRINSDPALIPVIIPQSVPTPLPVIKSPERTECRPTLGGGFDCTTY